MTPKGLDLMDGFEPVPVMGPAEVFNRDHRRRIHPHDFFEAQGPVFKIKNEIKQTGGVFGA
jgi:hypothetical protein